MNATASEPGAGGGAFVTTRWSVVLAAQGESPAAEQALEKLCRTYWWPLYSFVRRNGSNPEEAQDLTQDFFARLLKRRDFDAVQQEKGRLRSYLLVALKHFLSNARSRQSTIKRGLGQQIIPLEELANREHDEPADNLSADRLYERRWALTVLEQVLSRLDEEYRAGGNSALFDWFRKLLADECDRPSQAQVANEMGMSENAVKQAYHRFRKRYREVLREEIADTVVMPGDVENELRHLIEILRT